MNRKLEKILIMLVIAGQLLAQGFYLPIINIFPLYLILLVILGVYELANWFYLSQGKIVIRTENGIPFIMALMVLNIIIVHLFNFNFNLQSFALILFSMTLSLACYNAICSNDDITWMIKVYILIVLLSAVVELGQFLNISFCDDLWTFLHVGDKLTSAKEGGRYIGLASDSIQFAYHCTAAFALALFFKFKNNNLLKKSMIFAILLPAVFTNNTRSAMIAMVFIFAVWLFIYNTSFNSKVLKVSLVMLLLAVVLFSGKATEIFENSRFYSLNFDASSMARIPMVLTAFNHALHHPFGMGVYKVSPELVVGANSTTYWYVVINGSHNILGNCVASYGFVGLALLLLLYKRVICLYLDNLRYLENKYTFLSILLAIIGLLINSLFHNAYILNGDLSSCLFIGLILASSKLGRQVQTP